MVIKSIPTFTALVQLLKQDPVFRYTCSFEVMGEIPRVSTFNRLLKKMFLCQSKCTSKVMKKCTTLLPKIGLFIFNFISSNGKITLPFPRGGERQFHSFTIAIGV